MSVLGYQKYGDKKTEQYKADGVFVVETEEKKISESSGNVTKKEYTRLSKCK